MPLPCFALLPDSLCSSRASGIAAQAFCANHRGSSSPNLFASLPPPFCVSSSLSTPPHRWQGEGFFPALGGSICERGETIPPQVSGLVLAGGAEALGGCLSVKIWRVIPGPLYLETDTSCSRVGLEGQGDRYMSQCVILPVTRSSFVELHCDVLEACRP